MTAKDFFTADAQWALQGKTPGRDGYRVLACSSGRLSADNFTEAIGRFSMGTPETLPQALPQVTISYVLAGADNHLALAVNRLASADAPQDGQLMARDDDGRPVVVTSYYCVPYQPLAEHGVSYRAMYEAFAAVPLRPENGPALRVELPSAPPAGAGNGGGGIDPLAVKTAALLISGRPVCVLGASDTSMADRLAFIDTVMTLLPYGFRARMSAATWTRATNQNHRFRLFFSGARRDAKEPDHVVTWGRAEQTHVTAEDDIVAWYLNWLQGRSTGQRLSLLAGLTHPRSLGDRHEVLDALDEMDATFPPSLWAKLGRRPDSRSARKQHDPANGTGPGWDVPPPPRAAGEELLIDCAKYLENRDTQQLRDAVKLLNKPAIADVPPDQRKRYRELVKEHRLFRHDETLDEGEALLREALLRIAFPPPLSYEDYCLIEEGTGEAAVPDSALLQLIEKQGLADNRAKAIVYRQLPNAEAQRKLEEWFPSKDLSAERLLNLLAIKVNRPRHARLLCDVTVDYLRKMSGHYDPKVIGGVLRQHSYLARKLQDGLTDAEHQCQIETLGFFLQIVFPDGLARADLYRVLVGAAEPPTPAFLAAVLLALADKTDAPLARELYTFSSIMSMTLEGATGRELQKLLFPPEPPPFSAPPTAALPLQRKTSTPLPPDAPPPVTAGPQYTPRPAEAEAKKPADTAQPPEGGRHRARKPRESTDGS